MGLFSGSKPPSREAVLDCLREVKHPTLGKDVVDLGLIKNVQIEGDRVSLDLELTTPKSTVRDQLKALCELRLEKLSGIEKVLVRVTHRGEPQAAPPPPNPSPKGPTPPGVSHLVAVASGKGGVGKSTTAVHLAQALVASGHRVGLLDADIYGPSIPTMLGVHTKPQVTPEQKMIPIDARGLKLMSMGFLTEDADPAILRGPMVHNLLQQFLGAVDWGALDYLILDLPPGTGDVQLSLAQSVKLTGAVVVTTPQEVSLIDVRRAVNMFGKVQVPVLGIVENMSEFICPHCGEGSHIFRQGGGRELATKIKVPFLGAIPLDPNLVAACDEGRAFLREHADSPAALAYKDVASQILAQVVLVSSPKGSGDQDLSLDWT